MPTYTLLRTTDNKVLLQTDKLADIPDARTLAMMRSQGCIMLEDGKEVIGKHLSNVMMVKEMERIQAK